VRRVHYRRDTQKAVGDFAPFFDWDEMDESPSIGLVPSEDLTERIVASSEEWQAKGGVLVRSHFGVKTIRLSRENLGKVRNERTGRLDTVWGKLSGFYETQKYCCPLAPFLDGLPSRFNPLADFALILSVDHLWVLGFIHGFDKTEWFVGKREGQFNESLSYVDGYATGRKVGDRFYVIDVGWERQ
jgi:hypothetical protein